MEITEAHIKFAKRQLERGKSIPGVAGELSNRTPKEAEFSDLISIANQAQMELKNETADEDESDSTTNQPESTVEEDSGTSSDSSAEPTEETDAVAVEANDPPRIPGSNDDAPSVTNIVGDSTDQGETSWKK